VLVDCDAEFAQFFDTMTLLEDKLGVMLFQFPYFSKAKFKSGAEFLTRLKSFTRQLPKDHRFAVEIGNKNCLDARLADALREHNVALVLQDHSWMPRPTELFDKFGFSSSARPSARELALANVYTLLYIHILEAKHGHRSRI
jgi:uncharacterized protein YecE (DUF72 family)